jgi:hypothetical protein
LLKGEQAFISNAVEQEALNNTDLSKVLHSLNLDPHVMFPHIRFINPLLFTTLVASRPSFVSQDKEVLTDADAGGGGVGVPLCEKDREILMRGLKVSHVLVVHIQLVIPTS